MPVILICPNIRCRSRQSFPDAMRGKDAKCIDCKITLRVPESRSKPAPAPVPAALAAK